MLLPNVVGRQLHGLDRRIAAAAAATLAKGLAGRRRAELDLEVDPSAR